MLTYVKPSRRSWSCIAVASASITASLMFLRSGLQLLHPIGGLAATTGCLGRPCSAPGPADARPGTSANTAATSATTRTPRALGDTLVPSFPRDGPTCHGAPRPPALCPAHEPRAAGPGPPDGRFRLRA